MFRYKFKPFGLYVSGEMLQKFTPQNTISLDGVESYQRDILVNAETIELHENSSTNTLRVIQEQTESLSFEWKPMKHDSFVYVYLVQKRHNKSMTKKYINAGDIGNLPTIGEPCEATNYEADGYYSWYLWRYSFLTYYIGYERVPRIKNVRIQKQSDSSTRMTLERENSTCEVDTTVMFRGNSKNRLKMFIMPRNQVEYYMNYTEVKERSTEVFILFNRRGDRFSLPTIGNIFHVYRCLQNV
ncbi:unnamed protein product [Schistosoma margrebowiei]|uniref:Uncharacterized protein n=1 Tax=Schistosoma margrebowiei TaxID=48269 RepID=A0A183MVH3_9TREM|nr:unnamed protein product [Schistosoma margrebowiei]